MPVQVARSRMVYPHSSPLCPIDYALSFASYPYKLNTKYTNNHSHAKPTMAIANSLNTCFMPYPFIVEITLTAVAHALTRTPHAHQIGILNTPLST